VEKLVERGGRLAFVFHLLVFILLSGCATRTVVEMSEYGRYAPALKFNYSDKEWLNYEKRGSGETPLVLLHGFGCSLRNWDDVVAILAERGDLESKFTVYALDLKGAGFSSRPRDSRYTIKDNAAIVADFIKRLNLRGAILAGHSLGGGIALYATVEFLDGTEYYPGALLLVDTACYPTKFPFFVRFLRIPIVNQIILKGLPPKYRARKALAKIMEPGTPVTPELIKRYSYFGAFPGHDYVLIQTAEHILPDNAAELVSEYPDISCPVSIVWGEHDVVLSPSLGKRLNKDIPNSKLRIIEKCGHNPPEEKPAEIADALEELFSSAEKAGEG
jgi:pimeloyl-ACP methyl ester carboxylesterase